MTFSGEKGLAEVLSTWNRKDTDGWGKEITSDVKIMLHDRTFYILCLCVVVLKLS